MLNSSRVTTVVVQWMTVVYVVCSAFVALFPTLSRRVSDISLHMARPGILEDPRLTFGGFIVGLVFWDVVAYLAAALFVWLWNRTSEKKA